MKKLNLLCFSCLIVALIGLIPAGAAIAFDGDDGGFDGGFDGGGDDAGDEGADSGTDSEGAEDEDGEQDDHQGEDRDKDGRPDGHGHHGGHRHHGTGHHTHIIHGWPAYGFGPAFGFGAFGYTPAPYYGYSPGNFRPIQPGVVYVEKKDTQSAPEPQTNNWYYCREAEGYYPEVKECPGDWEQVPPQAEHDNQE
ncbi:hypothetical protein [Nitrosovibrio sp. Nv6]|uniref:hypothetical protein n=1 Tax=Nitrosovibrio sp. Nv6 TaxID=1855340 RepID=UPI0008D5CAC9|nr:hypothetical protein [Nitrosovibrio sp. Nv6]SEO75019.1 hypothetical protein SAMN05216316_0985 [Nitrosovibrio sp. Nv6]